MLRSKWTCEEFNSRFPIGTLVRYQPVEGEERYEERRTRSRAWPLGHGDPVVKLEGRTGGVCLGHITILQVPLSKQWTAADRLRVVAALLPGMQSDIYAGLYSAAGRPNVTSLQHVIHDEPEALEGYRAEFQKWVDANEKENPPCEEQTRIAN